MVLQMHEGKMEKKRDDDSDSAGSLKDFIDDDTSSENDSSNRDSNKESSKDSDIEEIIPEPKSRSHTPGIIFDCICIFEFFN